MENIDSVAVFYADGSYRHVTWDDAASLQGPLSKRVVQIHVYHVQAPGFPNQVVVNGYDDYCLRRTNEGLIARYGSMPPADPEAAFECYFTQGSSAQEIGTEIMPQLCMGGASAAFQSIDHSDPNYEDLDGRAGAVNLSEATVPGTGTY